MQFHIRTLLGLMVAASLLCGIVFAAPPVLAIPIMCGILWVCPAFWISGVVYARGRWRPFFIGGVMAGLAPHLAALFVSYLAITTLIGGDTLADVFDLDDQWTNILAAALLLGSGPFALIGGLIGMWVAWSFEPRPKANANDQPLASDEYVVVSGRLTALPAERGA